MYHPNGEKTEFINIPMAWIFGSNPNQATIFPKKKDHCLRNTYNTKICNIVILQHFITKTKRG